MNKALRRENETNRTKAMAIADLVPKDESLLAKPNSKVKQHQQEALMEKLRAKHKAKPRSYDDLKKLVRKYFEEKHFQMDQSCKERLRTTLDKLQMHIKVTTTQRLIERLESLSGSLALKFVTDSSGVFISADMFYVEVVLGKNGNPTDVKVHHECTKEAKSCSELTNCLKRKDFADFKQQLDGLSSIYQLNAEPKVKKKAFLALQSMETDIYNIYQVQNLNGNAYDFMAQSTVGLVQQRRGGHPMRLVYFCPPFHLTNGVYENSENFTIEQLLRSEYSLGASVKLEASSANKLQMEPTVSFSDKLIYAPLTSQNSTLMPAIYVLRLDQPLPVSKAALDELGLQAIPVHEQSDASQNVDFLSMVIRTASDNKLPDANRSLCVNLLDETHTYNYRDEANFKVVTINALQFTEPAQVPKIIAFLRKHTMLYKLLASTVRKMQGHYFDLQHTHRITIRLISSEQITVDLINVMDDTLANLDFILSDNDVKCVLYVLDTDFHEDLSEQLTRRVRRLHSIPQTIWFLHNVWRKGYNSSAGQHISTGGNSGGLPEKSSQNGANNDCAGNSIIKTEPAADIVTGMNLGEGNFEDVKNIRTQVESRSGAELFSAVVSEIHAVNNVMKLKQFTDPANTAAGISWDAAATAIDNLSKKYGNTWTEKDVLKAVSGGHLPADPDDYPSTSKACRQQAPNAEAVPDVNAGTGMPKDKKPSVVTPATIAANKRALETTAGAISDAQKPKKPKKKRDDSPMGPPEKVVSRQNSPGAGADAASALPTARKFPSPTSSPGQGSSSSNPTRPSPKHSPVYSSPKHSTASNSPKSPLFGTHSPKYGSSGKPSMSTLKNATSVTSLSPKGEKSTANALSVTSNPVGMMGRPFTSAVAAQGGANMAAANVVSRDKEKLVGPPTNVVNNAPALSNSLAPLVMQQAAQPHMVGANLAQQAPPKAVASLSHLAAGGSSNLAAFGTHGTAATGSSAGSLDLNAALRKGVAGGAIFPVLIGSI